jgi:hypothetical protein
MFSKFQPKRAATLLLLTLGDISSVPKSRFLESAAFLRRLSGQRSLHAHGAIVWNGGYFSLIPNP